MIVNTEVLTSVMRRAVLSIFGQSRGRTPRVGTVIIEALVLVGAEDSVADAEPSEVAVVVTVLITVLMIASLLFAL